MYSNDRLESEYQFLRYTISLTKTNEVPRTPLLPEVKGRKEKEHESERKKHVHALICSHRTNTSFDCANVMR